MAVEIYLMIMWVAAFIAYTIYVAYDLKRDAEAFEKKLDDIKNAIDYYAKSVETELAMNHTVIDTNAIYSEDLDEGELITGEESLEDTPLS